MEMCSECHEHPATAERPDGDSGLVCQFCLGVIVAEQWRASRNVAGAAVPGQHAHAPVGAPIAVGTAGDEPPRLPPDTPHLDALCVDLTARAAAGELDPVIGRDDELRQLTLILMRRIKNNPILTGDPGVGKTAVVEALAQQIVDGQAPDALAGVRILSLNMALLMAGTAYRGAFEERMEAIIAEVAACEGSVILFCDEFHALIGAGSSQGGISAANILKPPLARGELRLIGATTREEYRRYVESDAAFARRMIALEVPEPSEEVALEMLTGIAGRFESFHDGIRLEPSALEAAVRLSRRYVPERQLPDKAIDLIDQALALSRFTLQTSETPGQREARLETEARANERSAALMGQILAAVQAGDVEQAIELEAERVALAPDQFPGQVDAEAIARVVEKLTGVPVAEIQSDEATRLLDLDRLLGESVVGQDEALTTIARAVRRGRAGLSRGARPVSLLLLGSTGIGKTETARQLARLLFRDDKSFFQIDCSEFQAPHQIARLVGAPPGYVGYEDAGQLTEQIRRRPYSLILVDELEKANGTLFDILLQLIEDGRMTDGQGRTIDARHAVIVMTSNVGAGRSRRTGFAQDDRPDNDRERLVAAAKKTWRPEFLNRIDEIVCYRPLDDDSARQIVRLAYAPLVESCAERGFELSVDGSVERWLADTGLSDEYGARELRRTIARSLETPLSDLILAGPPAGARIRASIVDGRLDLSVDAPPAPAETVRESVLQSA